MLKDILTSGWDCVVDQISGHFKLYNLHLFLQVGPIRPYPSSYFVSIGRE